MYSGCSVAAVSLALTKASWARYEITFVKVSSEPRDGDGRFACCLDDETKARRDCKLLMRFET